jgi:hypothetical protein
VKRRYRKTTVVVPISHASDERFRLDSAILSQCSSTSTRAALRRLERVDRNRPSKLQVFCSPLGGAAKPIQYYIVLYARTASGSAPLRAALCEHCEPPKLTANLTATPPETGGNDGRGWT